MKSTTKVTLLVLALIGAFVNSATPVAARNTLDRPAANSSYLIPLGVADVNNDGVLSGQEAEAYCNGHEVDCQLFWKRLSEGNAEAHDYARASGLAALVDESEIVELGDVSANNEWDVAGKKGWYEKRKLSPRTRGYNHPAYGPWGRENCTNVIRPCGQLAAPRPPVAPAPEPPVFEPEPEPFMPTAIVVEHRVSGSIDVNVHGTVAVQASAPAPRQVNCPEAYRAWPEAYRLGGGRVYSERWRVDLHSADELAALWADHEPARCYPPVVAPPPPPRQVCQAPPPRRGGGFRFPPIFRPPPRPRVFIPPRPPQNRVVFVQGSPTNIVQNNNQNQDTNVNVQ